MALALSRRSARAARAQLPGAIAAPDAAPVVTLHAEGAQIYECKTGGDGKLAWAFREPIATLMLDGRTVGRHYAGPTWEHVDGSSVQAKVRRQRAGRDGKRYSLAQARRGRATAAAGTLAGADIVQRINTSGGVLRGPCDHAGRAAQRRPIPPTTSSCTRAAKTAAICRLDVIAASLAARARDHSAAWRVSSHGALSEPMANQKLNFGTIALVAALIAIMAAALWFAASAWIAMAGPPMPAVGYVAMILGIVISLVVGCGLMALLFYSSRHGYDEHPRSDLDANKLAVIEPRRIRVTSA